MDHITDTMDHRRHLRLEEESRAVIAEALRAAVTLAHLCAKVISITRKTYLRQLRFVTIVYLIFHEDSDKSLLQFF